MVRKSVSRLTGSVTGKRNFLENNNIALKIKLIKCGSSLQRNGMNVVTYLKYFELPSSKEVCLDCLLSAVKFHHLFCFVGKASFIS